MAQADKNYQGFSARLSSVLYDIGINETVIKRRRMLFINKTQTDPSSDIQVYQFGSQSEGLTTLDFQSDLETKLCDTRINIIQDRSEINPELLNISMIFDENDPPGYCRLQAPESCPAPEQRDIEYIFRLKLTSRYPYELPRNAFQSYVYGKDDNGRSYREDSFPTNRRLLEYHGKHRPYVIYRYHGRDAFIENRWFQIRLEREIHGPANSNTKADTNLVPAFTYRGRVLTRSQNYSGCFVVPVGHSHSENENIQWRIDTSVAERVLMFSLNITQIRCYVILKLIMITYFNSYVGEATSSYIAKSLLFHMIELKNEEFWSDRNLMLCIKALLNLLKIFVLSNNFPDYFISKRNLMEGKLNIEQRVLLFRKVQMLASDICQALLGISNCNFGKKVLLKCSQIRNCFPSETDYSVDEEGRRCMSMQDIDQLWHMGREKDLVLEECQRICSSIKKISDKILLVWPAYEANDAKMLVFVVNTTEEVKINVNYRIYQKVVGVFGGGKRGLMENHSNPENIPLDHSQAEKIRMKINKHASTLFQKHRLISGISGSGSRSAGIGARNLKQVPGPCIVIYVLVKDKIPLNEHHIPKYLDDIPVDIREGKFQTCALEADEFHDNLRMGCQIMSSANEDKVGTLGGFVEHQDYGLCGITCAHVVFNDERLHQCRGKRDDIIDDDVFVYQPNTKLQKHRVGPLRVVAYRPGGEDLSGIDLALFQIDSRPPETGMFPKHSNSERNLMYESGKFAREKQFQKYDQKVVKFGRTSGFTEGFVEFSGTAVRKIDYDREYTVNNIRFTYTLFNQLEIRPPFGKKTFCKGGDSGALVFKRDVTGHLICIGMVVGTYPNGNGIVTPISAIMNELGVSEMKTFTLNKIDRLEKQFERMEQKIDRLESQFQRMEQLLVRIDRNNQQT